MQEEKLNCGNFSYALEELLLSKGLKKKALARAINVTPGTISRWINSGVKPDMPTIRKIASYFGVSIDYFLADDVKKTSRLADDLLFKEEYKTAISEDYWQKRAIEAEMKLAALHASIKTLTDIISQMSELSSSKNTQ